MNGKDAFRLVLPVLPVDTSLASSPLLVNTLTSSLANTNLHALESTSSFGHSAPFTAPIAVPGGIHMNLVNLEMGKIATLETPPSPYPIHASTHKRGVSLEEEDAERSRFALGGLLGAASPRSLSVDSRDPVEGSTPSPRDSPSLSRVGSTGSTDSFALYGSHIPASISPPLPMRARPIIPVSAVATQEEYYISTR